MGGAGAVGGGFAEAFEAAFDRVALGFGEGVLLVGGHDAVLDGGEAEGAAAVAVFQALGDAFAFGEVVADFDGAREGGDSELVLLDEGDVGVGALAGGEAADDGDAFNLDGLAEDVEGGASVAFEDGDVFDEGAKDVGVGDFGVVEEGGHVAEEALGGDESGDG